MERRSRFAFVSMSTTENTEPWTAEDLQRWTFTVEKYGDMHASIVKHNVEKLILQRRILGNAQLYMDAFSKQQNNKTS